MIHDKLVRFCGTEFECVDEGFGENTPVDVVIRPEDLLYLPRFGYGAVDWCCSDLYF